MKAFNELPKHVQAEVKEVLQAFSRCNVTLGEHGYKVNTSHALHNGTYDQYIGEYKAEEIFTIEDRILNYVREFRDFPFHANGVTYKGNKDYKALASNWTDVQMVDGDLVFF